LTNFQIFLLVDSGRNLLLSGMHTTFIISLHYLIEYNERTRKFLCVLLKFYFRDFGMFFHIFIFRLLHYVAK